MVWLVTNTRDRDKLQTRDGDRCLLHAAAKYGQVRCMDFDMIENKAFIVLDSSLKGCRFSLHVVTFNGNQNFGNLH